MLNCLLLGSIFWFVTSSIPKDFHRRICESAASRNYLKNIFYYKGCISGLSFQFVQRILSSRFGRLSHSITKINNNDNDNYNEK